MQAEIEKILIKWNAALCLDTCIPLMERNLHAIKGVTDFQINPNAGVAEIHWDPQAHFSYEPFNLASRAVGSRILDIRVRVKGTIAHDRENFFISSLGDNTRFLLIGPIAPVPGGYTIRGNIASHPLSPSLKQQLLDAENAGKQVTIEGPLFQPTWYTLTLIAEQVNLPPPRNESFDQTQLRMR